MKRTYINLSFDLYLELMERQAHLKRQMLHQQICNKLYTYHCIYPFSVPHSNLMYLKVTLKPSPETLYAVMLLPYRHYLRGPEFPTKYHNTLDSLTILKEQKQHFTECRTYCGLSGYRYLFAPPSRLIKSYILLVSRKLLFLTLYAKDIVIFGMYQYSSESLCREYSNQFLRTIPAIKGNRELSQVYIKKSSTSWSMSLNISGLDVLALPCLLTGLILSGIILLPILMVMAMMF